MGTTMTARLKTVRRLSAALGLMALVSACHYYGPGSYHGYRGYYGPRYSYDHGYGRGYDHGYGRGYGFRGQGHHYRKRGPYGGRGW